MTLRPAFVLLAALPLLAAGCAGPSSDSRASAADRAACRQRAEQVNRLQNPDAVYRADAYASSTRDSPFGGSGMQDVSQGLSSSFAWQRMVNDCLNDNAGNVGTAPAAPPPEDSTGKQ